MSFFVMYKLFLFFYYYKAHKGPQQPTKANAGPRRQKKAQPWPPSALHHHQRVTTTRWWLHLFYYFNSLYQPTGAKTMTQTSRKMHEKGSNDGLPSFEVCFVI